MNGSTDFLGCVSPRLHPICRTDRWGKNPFLDNAYRVVFAPTRFSLVGGTDADTGETGYHMVPLYDAKGWILERWLSPLEFTGMGPERYEIEFRDPRTGLYVNGPYPTRGEYEMCWDFEANEPTQGYVDRLISMINAGRMRPFSEHKAAVQKHFDQRRNARRNQAADLIRDALPSFNAQPLSAPGTIRSHKNRPERLAANDLSFRGKPLPLGKNKFVAA